MSTISNCVPFANFQVRGRANLLLTQQTNPNNQIAIPNCSRLFFGENPFVDCVGTLGPQFFTLAPCHKEASVVNSKQVVLITGSSTGFGRLFAATLAPARGPDPRREGGSW